MQFYTAPFLLEIYGQGLNFMIYCICIGVNCGGGLPKSKKSLVVFADWGLFDYRLYIRRRSGKEKFMKKFFVAAALLPVLILAASQLTAGASNGDVVGNIYSTDIETVVNGRVAEGYNIIVAGQSKTLDAHCYNLTLTENVLCASIFQCDVHILLIPFARCLCFAPQAHTRHIVGEL